MKKDDKTEERTEKDDKKKVNADNASHNLDSKLDDQDRRPSRDVTEADFAAEAHGFTGFENTGQGSKYRGGALDDDTEDTASEDNGDGAGDENDRVD